MRKFDKGVFRGKKNPITGERMVARESLDAFMKQYNLSWSALAIEKMNILLASSDTRLSELVHRTFDEDESFNVERVEFGCDALYLCSKDKPALLIIDEKLPDIPAGDVVKSLRRVEEHKGLKILCIAAEESSRAEWTKAGVDECLSKGSLDEAILANSVCRMLNIAEEGPDTSHQFEHRRRCPRQDINAPAKISIYPVSDPSQGSTGEAVVRNLSLEGALLGPIRMSNRVMPGEPFRLSLEIEEGPLQNFKADCMVVRLKSNGSLTAGIQFVDVPEPSAEKIQMFLNA